MGLQEAWDAAWERVREHGETALIPERLPSPEGKELYKIKTYILEWVGPEPWNISCSCPGSSFGIICRHRAILRHYREGFSTLIKCPWCVRLEDDETLTPAGYHIFCEMDILALDAPFLRENPRHWHHAKRIRDFYLKGGLHIPIEPGKRTPLDDLWS